jgi:hypothetical protein
MLVHAGDACITYIYIVHMVVYVELMFVDLPLAVSHVCSFMYVYLWHEISY